MNLIPKIAEMLGVEIGEEFKLKSDDDVYKETYRLQNGLEYKSEYGFAESCRLKGLLMGIYEIVRLPYEPKNGYKYYYVYFACRELRVLNCIWRNETGDYQAKICGNCFRTQAEAEAHKYEIYEKLTGKKWVVQNEL